MANEFDHPHTQEDDLIHRLFVEEYASMCRTAYYALGDKGLAETAVQETFLVAIRFREKLEASVKPVAWLYKTLSYTIKHIRRDRNLLVLYTVPLDSLPEQETSHYDDCSILDPELKDSEDLKLLVEFYYQGYTIKELADQRGISIGACKMRIKRAKEHLRKKLE